MIGSTYSCQATRQHRRPLSPYIYLPSLTCLHPAHASADIGPLLCWGQAKAPSRCGRTWAVTSPRHNYHDQNSRLAEIYAYLRSETPILILMTRRSRYERSTALPADRHSIDPRPFSGGGQGGCIPGGERHRLLATLPPRLDRNDRRLV